MYYTVYQITNLVNNKIYVGAHKTENLEDNYMSSSEIVKSAINKYGRANFEKKILHKCRSEDGMYLKESKIVNKKFVARSDTYNITEGGRGGFQHYNGSPEHIESSKAGGKIGIKKLHEGIESGVYNDSRFKKGCARTLLMSKRGNDSKKMKTPIV